MRKIILLSFLLVLATFLLLAFSAEAAKKDKNSSTASGKSGRTPKVKETATVGNKLSENRNGPQISSEKQVSKKANRARKNNNDGVTSTAGGFASNRPEQTGAAAAAEPGNRRKKNLEFAPVGSCNVAGYVDDKQKRIKRVKKVSGFTFSAFQGGRTWRIGIKEFGEIWVAIRMALTAPQQSGPFTIPKFEVDYWSIAPREMKDTKFTAAKASLQAPFHRATFRTVDPGEASAVRFVIDKTDGDPTAATNLKNLVKLLKKQKSPLYGKSKANYLELTCTFPDSILLSPPEPTGPLGVANKKA